MKTTSAKRRIPKVGPLHRYSLLILICLAAGVRIYLFAFTYVISRDGVVYLALAGYFREGNLGKGLSHDFHPLYSLVIAALSYLIPGSALAGQVVSLVSGSLLVVPIYLLGKDLFGQRAGFLTGIILTWPGFQPTFCRRASMFSSLQGRSAQHGKALKLVAL
ncbi:MAG: glycosyltransferase family 39 protein [Deltaproteobacteria bacterium]|nr:glycosyltransferase family 39 protein [Deltaproteobacteria bacterium]